MSASNFFEPSLTTHCGHSISSEDISNFLVRIQARTRRQTTPDAAGGSITFTGGTLVGQALANVAVTMTGTSVTGSAVYNPCYSLNPFGL
jgi:hypothetical protein